MPDYRRFRVAGGTYFVTVNLLEWRPDTLGRHIDVLREAVRATRRERPFHIDAWVVLPDHMHRISTLPPGDADFWNHWKATKIRFASCRCPPHRATLRIRIAKGDRGVWQRCF